MTIIVTWSKKNQRARSDISRVDFAEPLVTLHTLRPSEALVCICTGRESTLRGCGEEGGGEGGLGGGGDVSGSGGGGSNAEGAERRGAAGAARLTGGREGVEWRGGAQATRLTGGREGGRELELSGGREGAEWRGAVGAPSEGGMGGGRMRGRGVTTVKGQRRRRGGG